MTKERLRNYQSIKKERDSLRHCLEEIETALYYPKIPSMSGMPPAPSTENTQEDLAIRHIELQKRYQEKMEELAAEQLAIEAAIESLGPDARMLLRYRYIQGLKWEEVCVRLNYSWSQTHRLHGDALQKLKKGAVKKRPKKNRWVSFTEIHRYFLRQ